MAVRGGGPTQESRGASGLDGSGGRRPDERMDGFEVCRRLRADPASEHTPIILLTAMNDLDLERKAAAAGATLCLRKPFDPEQVVRAVEQVLGREARPPASGERH